MKSFLEEYGITTVVAVVIFSLIGTSVFFRDTGGDNLKGFLNNFQSKAEIFEETSTAEVKTATYHSMFADITIQYEEGMTWSEWLSSSYGSAYPYDNINHTILLWHDSEGMTVELQIQPEDVITGTETSLI